jgi:hypothetical protein
MAQFHFGFVLTNDSTKNKKEKMIFFFIVLFELGQIMKICHGGKIYMSESKIKIKLSQL